MNVQQKLINLYILPEDGPMKSLQIDMQVIELSVHADINANRDDARVDAVIKYIKDVFPKVYPAEKREQLRSLISRSIHVSIYDGIVLSLPGVIIDGPQPAPSNHLADMEKLEEEVTNLSDRCNELQGENQSYKQQSANYEIEIDVLGKENDRLREDSQRWQEERKQLKEERSMAEDQEYKATTEAKKWHDRATLFEQEKAELQVELERAQRESKKVADLQRRVATLETQLSDAKDNEKHLREAQRKIEQENKELREKIRRLAEDAAHPNAPSSKGDSAKGPWLD